MNETLKSSSASDIIVEVTDYGGDYRKAYPEEDHPRFHGKLVLCSCLSCGKEFVLDGSYLLWDDELGLLIRGRGPEDPPISCPSCGSWRIGDEINVVSDVEEWSVIYIVKHDANPKTRVLRDRTSYSSEGNAMLAATMTLDRDDNDTVLIFSPDTAAGHLMKRECIYESIVLPAGLADDVIGDLVKKDISSKNAWR